MIFKDPNFSKISRQISEILPFFDFRTNVLCPYMGKMAKKKQNTTKVGVRVRPAVLVALKT